jgi:hypothetical protein
MAEGTTDPRLGATVEHVPGAPPAAQNERNLPEAGERFGGYSILRTLGKGGMGAVYEAEEIETGRRVALKVLKHSLDSPEARKRFLREGRLAASINHPNSVYIFGTEEIEGTPTIAMELVAGGTLQERVKSGGALPIGEAVDCVLQIIAGLEAAQKAGVLHRDIKPANCFIDEGGTIKVGDFGLSISTAPRGETDLTQAGTILGTPAFSSPEQLRGDELNVRSDIYSVGVTLYFLLTGRTPFEADNMVKLLATVLERPAPSPRKWRPEIPHPLAATVLKCLEKQPSDRFRHYDQLRKALLPFASAAPTPATLGLRMLASVVDGMVLVAIFLGLLLLLFGSIETPADLRVKHGLLAAALWMSIDTLVPIAWFGFLEGIWGLSPGKALFGLRVVGMDRAAPGIPRAVARAAILGVIGAPADVLDFVAASWSLVAELAAWAGMLGMFATARRSNGYAAVHDLLTGTRVIAREATQARSTLAASEELPPLAGDTPRIGPYHALDTLAKSENEEWILAYDARLFRRVWICKLASGTPPIEISRRHMRRFTRLRWLAGRRTQDENWDAYEAPSGQPLVSLLTKRHPWSEVRFWLLDLADELAASTKDDTAPPRLGMDQVWITAEGGAKLLDFPCPGLAPDAGGQGGGPADEQTNPRQLLMDVATAALEGRGVRANGARPRVPPGPLPMSVQQFFASLPSLAHGEEIAGALRELVRLPAEVSRGQRLGPLLACSFPSLLIILLFAVMGLLMVYWERKYHILELTGHVGLLGQMKRAAADPSRDEDPETLAKSIETLETYIAYRHGPTIRDPFAMSTPLAQAMDRTLAEQVVAAHPRVTEEQYQAAVKNLGAIVAAKQIEPMTILPMMAIPAVVGSLASLIVLALVSVPAAVIFRGGMLIWALGLAVVTIDGSPASRLRVLGRSLIAWSPTALALVAVFGTIVPVISIGDIEFRGTGYGAIGIVTAGVVLVIYFILGLVSALLPVRGIHDRLAGTWLVPR